MARRRQKGRDVGDREKTLIYFAEFMRVAGPWGATFLLTILLGAVLFVTRIHYVTASSMESFVDKRITERVPPRDVTERLTRMETTLHNIDHRLSELEKR